MGYMESITKQVGRKDKKKEKRKDKDKAAKNQADGTELSEVKVEVVSNHTNQHPAQVSRCWKCCEICFTLLENA